MSSLYNSWNKMAEALAPRQDSYLFKGAIQVCKRSGFAELYCILV